mmetsp:Transcript_104326/g.304552  ORF Transcript_104326/g.304552 Transcript_104326/m.304552 type:complete len:240 (+) Transcript_104326:667-1386(+)
MISASSEPQLTSVKNCLISPFLRGPRQIMASSWFGSMKPIDITARWSSTYTGDQPSLLWCTSWPSRPSICGTDGPQMSTSSKPTSMARAAKPKDSCADTVLLPTPPFPERTRIFLFTLLSLAFTSATAGSGFFASPDAQSFWFGQPEQDDAFPASSLLTPGQLSGALSGFSWSSLGMVSDAARFSVASSTLGVADFCARASSSSRFRPSGTPNCRPRRATAAAPAAARPARAPQAKVRA